MRRRPSHRPAARVRERGSQYSAPDERPVVVDASIACSWFANEPDRWGGRRLLTSDRVLLAPDMMAVEVASAWWKKIRREEMRAQDVEQAVTNLLALGIAWSPSSVLVRPALRLAADLGHSVHDCLYLALATERSAPLATADARLRGLAARVGVALWK